MDKWTCSVCGFEAENEIDRAKHLQDTAGDEKHQEGMIEEGKDKLEDIEDKGKEVWEDAKDKAGKVKEDVEEKM